MIKKSGGGGEFKYNTFNICKNICKYCSVPPPSTTIKEKNQKENKSTIYTEELIFTFHICF
jgi:wyosine [tRNA(Phe)-imidazoG37] synthetase (radical SAM superfamily)